MKTPDFKDYIDAEDVAMTMYTQVPRDKAWILLPLEQRLEWIAMAEAACHSAFEAGYSEGHNDCGDEEYDSGYSDALAERGLSNG